MTDAQPLAPQTPTPAPAASVEAPTTPPAPAGESAPETGTPVALQAELEKWKALSRQNEQRAKDNAEKAQRLDAIEEANKTELQKAQDAIAAAQKRAEDAEAARLRSEIARTKNVPVELLTAADETSLTAQAEALLAFRGNQTPPPQSSGAGTPSGAAPARIYKQSEINDLWATEKDNILRASQEGRIDTTS